MRTPPFLYRFLSKEARTREYVAVIERGSFLAARKLLKLGINASEALIATVEHGPLELVVQILKKGARVKPGRHDSRALLAASQSMLERKKKMKLLIDAGADVNAYVDSGKHTLLMFAIVNEDESFARLLIEYGADVNGRDARGHTPLKLARQSGQKDFAEFLIEEGARL